MFSIAIVTLRSSSWPLMRLRNATALSAPCSYGIPRRWPPIVMIVGTRSSRAHLDVRPNRLLELVVNFRVNDAVLERHGPAPASSGSSPCLRSVGQSAGSIRSKP